MVQRATYYQYICLHAMWIPKTEIQ